jgi:hypothetical protein
MAVLIDLTHARRARRLFGILLERYGLPWFLQGGAEKAFRIDPERLTQAVEMCAEWTTRRSGEELNEETRHWLHQDLRRMLIEQVAQSMVRAGY